MVTCEMRWLDIRCHWSFQRMYDRGREVCRRKWRTGSRTHL